MSAYALPTASWASGSFPFLFLFVFRYLRLVVHIISFWMYRPSPILESPSYSPSDCTGIIPTLDPTSKDFVECIESVLAAGPKNIFVVTVGSEKHAQAVSICKPIQHCFPASKIEVLSTQVANKRTQVAHAIPYIRTAFTVLIDDHVFWRSPNFLRSVLAPFEDPAVGVVGTNKRVRREYTDFSLASFWNFIGCLYLERHNFEIRSSNTIDGGVFAVSGRTSIHRTHNLQDPVFLSHFTNERFFFSRYGPLNADDDNFLTRWAVRKGWKIKIQYEDDALIETTLGEYPKFLSQCLRWARTTYRSNTASLVTDRTVWRTQPWSVYAVYITGLVNLALFWDAAIMLTLASSDLGKSFRYALPALALYIFANKLVKSFAHFRLHPRDIVFLPAYILFGYVHSLLQLYAACTFWVTTWSGRNLEHPVAEEKEMRTSVVSKLEVVDSTTPSIDDDTHELLIPMPDKRSMYPWPQLRLRRLLSL